MTGPESLLPKSGSTGNLTLASENLDALAQLGASAGHLVSEDLRRHVLNTLSIASVPGALPCTRVARGSDPIPLADGISFDWREADVFVDDAE